MGTIRGALQSREKFEAPPPGPPPFFGHKAIFFGGGRGVHAQHETTTSRKKI